MRRPKISIFTNISINGLTPQRFMPLKGDRGCYFFDFLVSLDRPHFFTYILQFLRFSALPIWSYNHVKVNSFMKNLLIGAFSFQLINDIK